MPLPKNKVTLYDKRIALYKKRIDKLKELQHEMRRVFDSSKAHYVAVVARHVNAERNLTDQIDSLTTAAIQDRFKLQDYEAQIANQWRENGGLREDVAAAKLNHDAKAKELRNVRFQLVEKTYATEDLERALVEARRGFVYVTRRAIATQWLSWRMAIAASGVRISLAFTNWKSRIVNRWMIRRLSKARVAALYEAGNIPDKLVRSALAFYEHDKRRLEIDEQIQSIHQGNDLITITRAKRPGLWRRFQIFIGRA